MICVCDVCVCVGDKCDAFKVQSCVMPLWGNVSVQQDVASQFCRCLISPTVRT